LPNVHLGVSVENQKYADERIPVLLQTPAAVRWISAEPLLAPIDVSRYLRRTTTEPATFCAVSPEMRAKYGDDPQDITLTRSTRGLDWVVVGGESGPSARQFDLTWARSIVRQCHDAGSACFVKQLGACASDPENGLAGARLRVDPDAAALVSRRLRDIKGEDPSEWPEDLRVRQFPTAFTTQLP
jgi:hypothetical protein